MTRHSREDALDQATFDRLLDACDDLEPTFSLQCRFVILLAGRLGLRAGEIAHCRESWIDWEREMLEIPRYEPCHAGEDGGVCGYCRKRARDAVRADTYEDMDAALAHRWEPKTENSARAVPFSHSDRVRDILETFFDRSDTYPASRISINRRVNRAAEAAGLNTEHVYPHALRATAATQMAVDGVSPAALQAIFGWADLSTAVKYVRASGEQARRALEATYD